MPIATVTAAGHPTWAHRELVAEAKQRLASRFATLEIAREKMLRLVDRSPADVDAALAEAQRALAMDGVVETLMERDAQPGEPLGAAGRIAFLIERGARDEDEARALAERAGRIGYARALKQQSK